MARGATAYRTDVFAQIAQATAQVMYDLCYTTKPGYLGAVYFRLDLDELWYQAVIEAELAQRHRFVKNP